MSVRNFFGQLHDQDLALDKNNHVRDNKHLSLRGVNTIVSWGCYLEIHIGSQRQISLVNNIVFKADQIFVVKNVYDPKNSAKHSICL